jgi:hypothetical protein
MTKTRTNKPGEDLQLPENSREVTPAPAAGDVLVEFNRLKSALAQTHTEIPNLLAAERSIGHELGLAEARGDAADALREQLDETVRQRQAAVRRRNASIAALVEMEAALLRDRAAAEGERERIAAEVAREFGERWREACDRLAALRAEAQVLGSALRTTIATPAPYIAFVNPIREEPELRPVAGSEPVTTALPAHLSILVARLDALDAALSRITAIKQARQLDQYHYDLSRVRGVAAEFPGTYRVTAAFDCLIDGLKFEAGTLIDSSLLGPGSLQRLVATRRFIHPAEFGSTRAA